MPGLYSSAVMPPPPSSTSLSRPPRVWRTLDWSHLSRPYTLTRSDDQEDAHDHVHEHEHVLFHAPAYELELALEADGPDRTDHVEPDRAAHRSSSPAAGTAAWVAEYESLLEASNTSRPRAATRASFPGSSGVGLRRPRADADGGGEPGRLLRRSRRRIGDLNEDHGDSSWTFNLPAPDSHPYLRYSTYGRDRGRDRNRERELERSRASLEGTGRDTRRDGVVFDESMDTWLETVLAAEPRSDGPAPASASVPVRPASTSAVPSDRPIARLPRRTASSRIDDQ